MPPSFFLYMSVMQLTVYKEDYVIIRNANEFKKAV